MSLAQLFYKVFNKTAYIKSYAKYFLVYFFVGKLFDIIFILKIMFNTSLLSHHFVAMWRTVGPSSKITFCPVWNIYRKFCAFTQNFTFHLPLYLLNRSHFLKRLEISMKIFIFN